MFTYFKVAVDEKEAKLSDGNYFEGDRGFGKIIMKFNLPTDFKYLKKFSTIKTTQFKICVI